MRLPFRTLVIAGLVLVVGAGTLVALRPPAAHAQNTAAIPSAATGGEYQLAVLPAGPGEPKQWLVLNTRTGELAHWVERVDHYAVYTQLKPGRISTGFERVPKSPAGR